MADISKKITRKSLAAKKRSAIKAVKIQAKEKIHEIKIEYASNPARQKSKSAEKEQKKQLKAQKINARLAYNARQPRQFSIGEDIFNAVSHGIGAGLSVAAIVLLILRAIVYAPSGRGAVVAGYAIFGASLFVMYMMSTLYHAITPYGARKIFSILDHCAIYLLIAGTYTPFILTKVPQDYTILFLCIIWVLCALLIALYASLGERLRSFSVLSYIILGLVGTFIFTVYPFAAQVGKVSKVFLLAGAISHIVGFFFFAVNRFKWTHSIFHLFSLAGNILQFFGVFYALP